MKGKVSLIVFATVVAQMASAPNSQAQITIAPTTSTSNVVTIVPVTTTSTIQVFNPLTEVFEPQTTTTTTFTTITTAVTITIPPNVSAAVAAAAFAANQNTNSISDINQPSLLPTRLIALTQQPIQTPTAILTLIDPVYDGVWELDYSNPSVKQVGWSGAETTFSYKCVGTKCDPADKPDDYVHLNLGS